MQSLSLPTVRYIPNYTDQEADTKVLNEIYQDFARRDGWNLKNKINGRQGVITGNYCAYYEWTPSKDGGYVHKVIIPVRDMIIDPQATSSEDWRYVGRRFFATKKQLKADNLLRRFTNISNNLLILQQKLMLVRLRWA